VDDSDYSNKSQNEFGKNPMLRFGHFKDSAVALSASIMLLATGFFGFSSFTWAISTSILDFIEVWYGYFHIP
jgi:hypothetical protein